MKKLLLRLVTVCMVLSIASLPVYGTSPTEVSGDFDYEPTIIHDEFRGDNWFVWATDIEWWTGDLEGTATSEYKVIFHRSGVATFSSKGVFEGSVLGSETGTLEYQLTGILQAGAKEWQGTWWMGNGTDGLENAHGQGTWDGPGWPNPSPMCSYQGQVHFDPQTD
jgi:hypothetical protein